MNGTCSAQYIAPLFVFLPPTDGLLSLAGVSVQGPHLLLSLPFVRRILEHCCIDLNEYLDKGPRRAPTNLRAAISPPEHRLRRRLWTVLVDDYFQNLVPPQATVLDLGCGYGEFINSVACHRKLAMDLNPKSQEFLSPDVQLIAQDCSAPWPLDNDSIDLVFTSNFFEHLPDKFSLKRTLQQAARCLRRGGRLIALGPNIKIVNGAYWDFWDHFLCLTELSLAEALSANGFALRRVVARFLPYTTVNVPRYPLVPRSSVPANAGILAPFRKTIHGSRRKDIGAMTSKRW